MLQFVTWSDTSNKMVLWDKTFLYKLQLYNSGIANNEQPKHTTKLYSVHCLLEICVSIYQTDFTRIAYFESDS